MPKLNSRLFAHPVRAARHAVHGVYNEVRLAHASRSVDYLLLSYPKSGRTWLRYVLSCYFADSLGLRTLPDMSSMFQVLPNLAWDRERGLPAYREGPATARVPLIAVTHGVPMRGSLACRPAIFMLRDARDVVVSRYYHATRHKHQFGQSISEFIRDSKQGLPAWVDHTNRCASALADRRHIMVSYERLTASPAHETARVLAFLEQPADSQRIANALSHASIERMRALEIQTGIPGHRYDRSDPQALRMRRGIVGGFRDDLSGQDLDWIEDHKIKYLTSPALDLLASVGIY
jgi:hypothetical protein